MNNINASFPTNIVNKYKYKIFHYIGPRREDFLKTLPQNSIGAEIGVFKGEFSKFILTVVKPKQLFLIDGWWKVYGDTFSWSGIETDFGKLTTHKAYECTEQVLAKYDKDKVAQILVGNDLQIIKKFKNNFFDWVYLDTSHEYAQTKKELDLLDSKIKKNGYIIGHDWQPDRTHIHHGVYKAVIEFCKERKWKVIATDYHTQWAIRRI
jgi:hypothetical protein